MGTTDDGRAADRARLFLSFDRSETEALAVRLAGALEPRGFEVYSEPARELSSSRRELARSDALLALLSPGATAADAPPLCREELWLAGSHEPPLPILPVLALPCEVPLLIYNLHYIDMVGWQDSPAVFATGLDRLERAIRAHLEVVPHA